MSSFWLLSSSTIKYGQISQTLHILNFCLLLFPLQVDVSSPGARRVAFKPDCRRLTTSVSLLSRPIDRIQPNKTAHALPPRLPAVEQSSLRVAWSPAASAGPHCHGYGVYLLGLFVLLWTLSGITQAWVRSCSFFCVFQALHWAVLKQFLSLQGTK